MTQTETSDSLTPLTQDDAAGGVQGVQVAQGFRSYLDVLVTNETSIQRSHGYDRVRPESNGGFDHLQDQGVEGCTLELTSAH